MLDELKRPPARNEYQEKRLRFLRSNADIDSLVGLEIGACHLPTVPQGIGHCFYADFRTAEQMVSMWGLDPNAVCHVDFVIERSRSLPDQIPTHFDYVIACHVFEHVPDPISYLQELAGLLKPGGIAFLAVPDKRMTPDKNRPLTTIDHLLMDHHDRCRYPTIEHIMDFHRHWLELESNSPLPIGEVYDYARAFHASGEADVHCHVWNDKSFLEQFETLSQARLLGNFEFTAFEPTLDGYNEFVAIFTLR